MSTAKNQPRYALVAARLMLTAALLVFATATKADIAYSIVDYPVNESDQIAAGTDTVSGTIITDGTLGSLNPSNILGGSLTVAYPGGSYTAPWPSVAYYTTPCLFADATALTLPGGAVASLFSRPSMVPQPHSFPTLTPTTTLTAHLPAMISRPGRTPRGYRSRISTLSRHSPYQVQSG